MPRKRPEREVGSEQQLVTAIRTLKEQRGLTYEQIAQRMTDAGCKMHPSGVQKTVEQGRRVTVDELVGYARAFDTTPESLLQYGGQREPRTQESWRDLLGAAELRAGLDYFQGIYKSKIHGVQLELRRNTELRREIESRLEQHTRGAERRAREQAELDDEDVSTPEKLRNYAWNNWADSMMLTCRDALRRPRKPRGNPASNEADVLLARAATGLDPSAPSYARDVLARLKTLTEGEK